MTKEVQMETVFNDAEPADAYDAGDPIETRIRVLRSMVDYAKREADADRRQIRLREARRVLDGIADTLHLLMDEVDEVRGETNG